MSVVVQLRPIMQSIVAVKTCGVHIPTNPGKQTVGDSQLPMYIHICIYGTGRVETFTCNHNNFDSISCAHGGWGIINDGSLKSVFQENMLTRHEGTGTYRFFKCVYIHLYSPQNTQIKV